MTSTSTHPTSLHARESYAEIDTTREPANDSTVSHAVASMAQSLAAGRPDAARDPVKMHDPACMSEGEFYARMEELRAGWNAMIDAMLDEAYPNWREERARLEAAAA